MLAPDPLTLPPCTPDNGLDYLAQVGVLDAAIELYGLHALRWLFVTHCVRFILDFTSESGQQVKDEFEAAQRLASEAFDGAAQKDVKRAQARACVEASRPRVQELFDLTFVEYEVLNVQNLRDPASVYGYADGLEQPSHAIVDADGATIGRGVGREDAMLDGLVREVSRLSNFEDNVHQYVSELNDARRSLNGLIGLDQ